MGLGTDSTKLKTSCQYRNFQEFQDIENKSQEMRHKKEAPELETSEVYSGA